MSLQCHFSSNQNNCRFHKRLYLYWLLVLYFVLFLSSGTAISQRTVEQSIEQANSELWNKFIDKYGMIRDFVGETPTPEDCTLGRPNVIGWWSPIENGPFFTGLYLMSACERAKRTGKKTDWVKVQRLANGLLKCASVSDVKGFVTRGIGTDGKCHYPLGSVDQTIPWYLGLYSYVLSDIPYAKHKKLVRNKLLEVTEDLNSLDWKLPCDGHFKGDFRRDLKSNNYLEVTSYLFVLRMMYQLSKDTSWLTKYQTALYEYPRGSVEQPIISKRTRIEICSSGYLIDSTVFKNKNFDKTQLWIYVKNQATLVHLINMENDEKVKAIFYSGLKQNVRNALNVISEYKQFDNNDKKFFGHANWREGYPLWFPQNSQEEAEKLASAGGNKDILGERKRYEKTFMTNPLAAAAIIALGDDGTNREIVEKAICHYDYSKLNLSEFLFAEVAFYSYPKHNK